MSVVRVPLTKGMTDMLSENKHEKGMWEEMEEVSLACQKKEGKERKENHSGREEEFITCSELCLPTSAFSATLPVV